MTAGGLLVLTGWTDWKTKRIPNTYIIGIIAAGLGSMWLMQEVSLIQRIAGIFVVSVPLLIVAVLTHGGIGGGDIKLMAAGGFLLGTAKVWDAFQIGILCAGLYVLVLLFIKKIESSI